MIKVMTYNIKDGGQDDFDYARLGLLTNVITAESPDILVLQELKYADLGGNHVLHQIENAAGMRSFFAHAKTNQHVAVFVRKGAKVVRSYYDTFNFHHAVVDVVVETTRGQLRVVGTHLCPHGGENRLAEVQRLANYAKPDQLVLLMGDLNSLDPWTDHEEHIKKVPLPYRSRHLLPASDHKVDTRAVATLANAGFVDLYRSLPGGTKGYTAPTRDGGGHEFFQMRVDYILGTAPLVRLTKGCYVVASEGSERASDHYPVAAELDVDLAS